MSRQNTKLESLGAEFLVLGQLLIEGMDAYKAYVNFPGYDLTVIDAKTKRVARVQVKSRWATDYDRSFPIKNSDCDFVVHVALNRGYSFSRKASAETGVQNPDIYVFPIDVVMQVRGQDSWGKVRLVKIANYMEYKNRWALIKEFLGRPITPNRILDQ